MRTVTESQYITLLVGVVALADVAEIFVEKLPRCVACVGEGHSLDAGPVSYTHLTLPTKA